MHLVELAAVVRSPWRNGGGQTRELLVWPASHDWTLRVSVADVTADGTFSTYPGIDRWIAVLGGDGVTLSVDDHEPVGLRPTDLQMHAFAGESRVHCVLPGSPTTDLNVMVSRAHWRAVVTPTRVASRLTSTAGFIGCYADAACRFHIPGSPPRELAGAGFAWRTNGAGESLHIGLAAPVPRGWWIELLPCDPRPAATAQGRHDTIHGSGDTRRD